MTDRLNQLRNDKQHFQDGLYIWDIPTFNESAVREVILESGAVRLEGREVRGVEVEHVLVGDDHSNVTEGLVGVHGALDALGQRNRLQAGTQSTGGSLEEVLEEALDTLEAAHAADASTQAGPPRGPLYRSC